MKDYWKAVMHCKVHVRFGGRQLEKVPQSRDNSLAAHPKCDHTSLRDETSQGKHRFYLLILPDLHPVITVSFWAFPFIARLPTMDALYLILVHQYQFWYTLPSDSLSRETPLRFANSSLLTRPVRDFNPKELVYAWHTKKLSISRQPTRSFGS